LQKLIKNKNNKLLKKMTLLKILEKKRRDHINNTNYRSKYIVNILDKLITLYSNPSKDNIFEMEYFFQKKRKYINKNISLITSYWSIKRLICRILKYINRIQERLGKYNDIITEWIRYLKHHLRESDHIEFGFQVISPNHITDSQHYSGRLSSHSLNECIVDKMTSIYNSEILSKYFIYAFGCDSLIQLLDYLEKSCCIVIERSSIESIKKQLELNHDIYIEYMS
jgi:hypothetical protein